jgi:hypothetical protein
MEYENYSVKFVHDQGRETFVLAFSKLAQGRLVRMNLYETEGELRDELKWMGLSCTRIEELIRQARRNV